MIKINTEQELYNLFKKAKGKYIQKGDDEGMIWYVKDVYFNKKSERGKIKIKYLREGKMDTFQQVLQLRNMGKWSDRWIILSKIEVTKIQMLNELK